jgi:dTDP-4-dehydrorhamnose reductase
VVAEIKRKVLITGSDGMLGAAIVRELSPDYSVIGTTIKDLDITDSKKSARHFWKINPGW